MRLRDKIRIFFTYVLSKPNRLINLFFIYLSIWLKLTKPIGKPITAMIEPINYCNLKCPLCPTGQGLIKRKKQSMSFKEFKRILDSLGNSIIHLRLWNWGEPLMNKDLGKMIRYAKSKKIFVNTSTNSFFLDEKIIEELVKAKLDQLIISLDGASQETYLKYRKKGDFNKVIRSLKKAAEIKRKLKTRYPEIKLQFIVMKHNEHEIKKVIKLAKLTKADTLFFKTLGVMDPKLKNQAKKYLPKNKIFRRSMLRESKEKINLSGRVCDYLWKEITINVDGSVVPCCRDSHNKYVFGNIKNQKLGEIWNNESMVKFRKQVLKNKNVFDICRLCSGSNKEFSITEINLKQ